MGQPRPGLWPYRRVRWRRKLVCTQRGVFRLGEARLRTGDPFGFFERERSYAQTRRRPAGARLPAGRARCGVWRCRCTTRRSTWSARAATSPTRPAPRRCASIGPTIRAADPLGQHRAARQPAGARPRASYQPAREPAAGRARLQLRRVPRRTAGARRCRPRVDRRVPPGSGRATSFLANTATPVVIRPGASVPHLQRRSKAWRVWTRRPGRAWCRGRSSTCPRATPSSCVRRTCRPDLAPTDQPPRRTRDCATCCSVRPPVDETGRALAASARCGSRRAATLAALLEGRAREHAHRRSAHDAGRCWRMEAALVLPIISLPTQGDRLPGLLGPLLLLLLLPAGCAAVYLFPALRDPSWRLLAGIGLALFTRVVVSQVSEEAMPRLDGLAGAQLRARRDRRRAVVARRRVWRSPSSRPPTCAASSACWRSACGRAGADPTLSAGGPGAAGHRCGAVRRGGADRHGAVAPGCRRADAPRLGRTSGGRHRDHAACCRRRSWSGCCDPSCWTRCGCCLARAYRTAAHPDRPAVELAGLAPPAGHARADAAAAAHADAGADSRRGARRRRRNGWRGSATVIVVTLLIVAGLATLLAARLLLNNFIRDPQQWVSEQQGEEFIAESQRQAQRGGERPARLVDALAARAARPSVEAGVSTAIAIPRRPTCGSIYRRLLDWADAQGLGRRASRDDRPVLGSDRTRGA